MKQVPVEQNSYRMPPQDGVTVARFLTVVDIVQQHQLSGDLWESTALAFLPHPSLPTASGAIGEYNDKFMSNQLVLKGGRCITPREHVRWSCRSLAYA